MTSQTLLAKEQPFDDSAILHIAYPDWFKTSFLDFQSDLEEARANHKDGLMLLFTTDGCSYCDRFIQVSLGNPELATRVRARYDSIGLEIFDDSEMTAPDGAQTVVKHFAKGLGAAFSPTLVFLGLDGEVLLRRVGYQSPQKFEQILNYLSEDNQTLSFRDYLLKQEVSQVKDYVLRDDPLFARQPYMLDRSRLPAGKPLIVLFEKNGCAECAQLHDVVLADQKVRQTLEAFEVVRLDMNDNRTPLVRPDGQRDTPSAWFDQAGLLQTPAMLFFDEHGNEVLRTDALVLNQRMMNSLNFVIEQAYIKGWTYQRFARSKGAEKLQKQQQ
jgi:thioredoxin-related protein